MLFTANEAAVVTRLPLKAVHNAIDRMTVALAGKGETGQGVRLLDRTNLLCLALERRLASRFQPSLRRDLFGALATARRIVVLDGGFLKVDLREPRRELAAGLRDLRRVRRMVHADSAIMGGQPVFRDTRLSPYIVAGLLDQGETIASLLDAYPSLTPEMARLAPVFATAYPERGRPPSQPWSERRLVRHVSRPLSGSTVV